MALPHKLGSEEWLSLTQFRNAIFCKW